MSLTQQELDKHFYRCYTEFPYYASHNLKIRTKEGTLTNFDLNEVQLLMEEIVLDMESKGLPIRLYVLKARQEGISTWSTGRFFWKVSNNKNRSAVIVTHEPPATRNLFDMQKRYYKHLEPEFKPNSKYNNVKMLQFDNDDETGLDSSISVATAGVKDFGSSQTINYLHISELSKWPRENEEDLLTSLFQCVPDEADTAIVIESTAKGVGGEFYKGFFACRYRYEIYLEGGEPKWKVFINKDADATNSYSSVFIPWYVFKKYRMPAPSNFTRTVEEELMVQDYGLDDEQLYWYRHTLANKCKGKKTIRDQEYPSTPEAAFVGSGNPAFDIEQVTRLMKECKDAPFKYTYNQSLDKLMDNSDGNIMIWDEPRRGVPYLISADVAEGLEHGDFNSAIVWNHATGEQVAEFHGHLSPFKFAYLLNFLGRKYNEAWLVPERNNHGISVTEKLLELEYPNLYVEVIPDPPGKAKRRFGWVTSTKTRVLMLDHLIDDVTDGICGIRSAEIYREMLSFRTQADGKVEADSGRHDDRVIAAAIGRYTIKSLPFVVNFGNGSFYSSRDHNTEPSLIPRISQKRPPVSAWN